MIKKFSTLIIFLICATSGFAAPLLHVVHNVYEKGFSIDGYDLLYDEQNKNEIKLGDQFYIQDKTIDQITEGSYQYLLLLTNSKTRETSCFKSRIINNQDSVPILDVEKLESGDYNVTLEDGSQYKLTHQQNKSFQVEPGDMLSFGGLDRYALWRNYYGNFEEHRADGSKHWLGDLPKEEKSVWDNSGLSNRNMLFFGGAVLDWHYSAYSKTWNYPDCIFYTVTINRDNVPLPGFFRTTGLLRKPTPLVNSNTFRIRWAGEYEIKRTVACIVSYYLIEFFDFRPGCKLSLSNPDDLSKLQSCNTLRFVSKKNEREFIFETPDNEKIILCLDLQERARQY